MGETSNAQKMLTWKSRRRWCSWDDVL